MRFSKFFLFLTGAIFFYFGLNEARAAVFYSQESGDPANLSNWNTLRAGGGANPAGFSGGDTFVIQNFHTLATNGSWRISGAGARLRIETGGHLDVFHQADFDDAVLEINAGGILNAVSGTINLNGTTASVSSAGAMFLHDSHLKVDGSLSILANGLNVRGASVITMGAAHSSKIQISDGAFFNWTDDGNRGLKAAASGFLYVGGGGIENNGTIKINGGTNNCGEADAIVLRSIVPNAARIWSGNGYFTLIDVDIKDQTKLGASLSAQNSTDSGGNSNIFFEPCAPATASADIGGKVIAPSGNGIPNVILTLTNLTRGDVIVRRTNSSGYYRFTNLEVGDSFLLQANHKFYRFSSGTTFLLIGDRWDLNFNGVF